MTYSRILITGMSGAGKTTVLRALAARGDDTVDTDEGGEWSAVIDGEPMWREDSMDELLSLPRDAPLIVQGTVAKQGRFYDRFDAVVLLSAPVEVMLGRVAIRRPGHYGSTPEDRANVARDHAEVEPLLRRRATHELDTTLPVSDVVEALVEIVGERR